MSALRDGVARVRAARRGELIGLAVVTGVLVASAVWHPSDDGGLVICPFRRALGLPCPGCGLTRAFCAIAKGHVERGFEFHTLGPALFLVACLYWVRGAAAVLGYERAAARFDETVRRWRLARAGVVLMLIAWVVRLAELGMAGQLPALARQGELLRWFFS